MYFFKTPDIIQKLFPRITWKMEDSERVVYLTFDDGPIPEVTPFVLDVLRDNGAEASFFCVGENAYKHNEIYKLILENGHTVGNHTYNHLSSWSVSGQEYTENCEKASMYISSSWFRPPYGKLTPLTYSTLLKMHYKICMWDILTGDFDTTKNSNSILENCKKYVSNGSILVLHDNVKTFKTLETLLPQLCHFLGSEGYKMRALPKLQNNKTNQIGRK